MELTLRNIYCYGEKNSNLYMSIGVHYGWNEAMYADIIKLNYNGAKEQIFLTVKAKNPGMGIVIESIISTLKDIDLREDARANSPEIIIEILSRKMGMSYDHEIVEEVLARYKKYQLEQGE
jgi:hypothetical protein